MSTLIPVGAAVLPDSVTPRALPVGLIMVVEQALAHAWASVVPQLPVLTSNAKSLKQQLEVVLNNAVATYLDELLHAGSIPGFNTLTFSGVARDAQIPSFNGTTLAKRPDIAIGLANPLANVGQFEQVFIEAKIVCKTRSLTAEYGNEGVARYASGDYAWAMRSALMLGYCTQPVRPWTDLEKALKACQGGTRTSGSGQALNLHSATAPWSDHDRSWTFPQSGSCPGDLRLWHVWLHL